MHYPIFTQDTAQARNNSSLLKNPFWDILLVFFKFIFDFVHEISMAKYVWYEINI